MKPNLVLLVALLVVGAGILAAGCTAPGGNVTQPTGTGTPTATRDSDRNGDRERHNGSDDRSGRRGCDRRPRRR